MIERIRHELVALGLLFVCIVAIWFVALGLRPGYCVAGGDLLLLLPRYVALAAVDGDLASSLFTPNPVGGAALTPVLGLLPITQLLAFAGAGPTVIINGTIWFLQLALGYLGARAALALSTAPAPLALRTLVALVLAFAPVVLWRIGAGHDSMLAGALAFVAAFAVVACAVRRSLDSVLVVVAFLALWHSISGHGQQLVLYGALLGLPVAAAGAVDAGGNSRRAIAFGIALCALMSVAALAAAAPVLVVMLDAFRSGDLSRSLEDSAIYSHVVVGEWRDLLGSSTMTFTDASGWRAPPYHHESNFPFGIYLVVAVAFPGRGTRRTAIALGIVAVVAVVVAGRVQPFARFIVDVVPGLEAFRVPTRMGLVIALLLALLACARVCSVSAEQKLTRPHALLALAFTALPLALGAFGLVGVAELAAAGAVAVVGVLSRRSAVPYAPLAVSGALLALSLVSSSTTRVQPSETDDALLRAKLGGQELIGVAPSSTAPATRVLLDLELPPFRDNSAWALGVESVDGYAFPTRRSVELLSALRGAVFPEYTRVGWGFSQTSRNLDVLGALYNVTHVISASPEGRLSSAPLSSAPAQSSPAWLVDRVQRVRVVRDVVHELADADDAGALVRSVAFVVEGDAVSEPTAGCAAGAGVAVRGVRGRDGAVAFDVAGVSAPCLVVVSQSYLSFMRALDQSGRALATFPVHGALTGVAVDGAVRSFELKPALATVPGGSVGSRVLALLLLAAALVIAARVTTRMQRAVDVAGA